LADQASLWELCAASGPTDHRFLLDQAQRFRLDALAAGTTLGGMRDELHGANVAILTRTQLGTALALLELHGVARRIVLCAPDLSPQYLPGAFATAEVTAVVCSRPMPELADAGITCIVSSAPDVTPARSVVGSRFETEWILFTSGTMGLPKMALHRLGTLAGAIPPRGTGRGGVWSTFYDIRRYGGLQILLRALVGGGSMVLSEANEAATEFLTRLRAAGVTFISGTPTHWRCALLSPQAAAIAPADVRLSGEVADQNILDKLRATYPNARICHAFASTEAGVAFEVDDGLAGFPIAWVDQVRNGVELLISEGTLRIRSQRTADRYLGAHTAPLKRADGFVDTKDIVERRGDRYYFRGRRDGVINVGGLKVHPEEVEEVVNRDPRVAASLVKAKRSPIIGEIVVVDVVLAATAAGVVSHQVLEADIQGSCRRALPWYKVPAMVRVVSSLAVGGSGKLIRTGA
jgi:acyl-coenzyme A synthetase/AMP-(fatty) acid ligase